MVDAEWKLLLYIPNIIDYIRFVLTIISGIILSTCDQWQKTGDLWSDFTLANPCVPGLIIYGVAAVLDFFDGAAARRYNQASVFGTWLDVVVDLFGRTMLWQIANVKFLSWFVPCVEWLTFVCIHSEHGSGKHGNWKEIINGSRSTPSFVTKVFNNNFRSIYGSWVIASFYCLPILVILAKKLPIIAPNTTFFISVPASCLLFLLSSGIIYGLCVTFWLIFNHIRQLVAAGSPRMLISQQTIKAIREQQVADFPNLHND